MNNLLLTTNFMLIAVSAAAMDRSAVIFESRYQAWKESARPAARLQSTARGLVDTPEFQAIVDLGPLALPHIAAKWNRMRQRTSCGMLSEELRRSKYAKSMMLPRIVSSFQIIQIWRGEVMYICIGGALGVFESDRSFLSYMKSGKRWSVNTRTVRLSMSIDGSSTLDFRSCRIWWM